MDADIKPLQPAAEYKLQEDEKEGYLRKVYGIVTFQLAISFGLAYLASAYEPFGTFCLNPATIITAFVVFIVSLISSLCVKNKVPFNYIALLCFTVSMGLLLSTLTVWFDPRSVLDAMAVTLFMSLAITVYTFIAGETAVIWAFFGIIFGVFIVEFLFLSLVISGGEWALSFYCSGVAFLYGCFLVIDTYIIKESSNLDDYIVAAIMIYMDVIRIFIYILMIFGSKK